MQLSKWLAEFHEGSESAVNSTLVVYFESKCAGEEAICAGDLTQFLLLLRSQCSGRTKNKGTNVAQTTWIHVD